MTEISDKKRKLFQVAKELNLAHTTLMDFLNAKGFDTPKKHLSIVSPEMYEEIVRKFDRHRWKDIEEEVYDKTESVKQKEADRMREAEINRILQTSPDTLKKQNEEKAVSKQLKEPVSPAKLKIDKDISAEAESITETKIPEIPAAARKTEKKESGVLAEEKVVLPKVKKAQDTAQPLKADKKEAKEETVKESEPVAKVIAKTDEDKSVEPVDIPDKKAGMVPVDQVVAEAMEIAKRKKNIFKVQAEKPEETKKEKPKKSKKGKPDKESETTDKEEDKDTKRKKTRRKKKPKRPETPSPAAIGLEKEKRARKPKPGAAESSTDASTKRKRRKGKKKKKVDSKEVEASIKETLAKIDDKSKTRKKKRRTTEVEEVFVESNILEVTEFISAQELANLMDVSVNDVIRKAMEMGLLISINQRLDEDTITLLTDEFEFDVEFISHVEEIVLEEDVIDAEELPRAPVVTVMGHVDHGKTSLLDYIRRSNIIDGESGGITQHIGAYRVDYNDRFITFLDTPGHEAFTAMRARGAQVTDIVVLVVAADDQVMPQTVEAINHSLAAGVPIIIAINKIDKPNAQPEKVRKQLADRNILVEDWGGKYQCTEISAKHGTNIDKLMEEILLLTDLLELKAPQACKAKGVVIDSQLDKGRGALATILVQKGILRVGDYFVADQFAGKVRALLDERGNKVENAGPSHPVVVLGFEGTPQAGENYMVTATEKEARTISLRRQQLQRAQSFRQIRMITLDQISDQIKFGELKELPLLIKGDVHGSVEAIADSLMKLKTEEVGVAVIHKAVGAITEGDVLLASASNAVIIGFHVHANKKARELSQREQVEIKSYRIIYDVVNDVKKTLEGLLRPEVKEEVTGEVEIRNTFKISAVGTIAGCYVTDGKIDRYLRVKVYRNGVEIFDGEIDSLKRFKEDVKEVASGYECGIRLKNFNDIKVGDIIEPYKVVETKRVLEM